MSRAGGSITRAVRYVVPVYVTIEAGKITRVVVDDEAARLDEQVPPAVRELLDTQEWPGWEFGG